MSSTELVAADQAALDALKAEQDEEYGEVRFQTPILKLTQSGTAEVKREKAEAGEWYNTLTDESYGSTVDFIVAYFQRGRSMSTDDGKYYISIAEDLIPESWKDAVGEAFVGTRFDEHPDAEEMYKQRINDNDLPWGKGPKISTTYNYTGLVLPPGIEDDDVVPEPMPVRLSFLRSTRAAHDKLMSLKRATMRNKNFFEVVFRLSTELKEFKRGDSYIVNVAKVGPSSPEHQLLAFELAQAVKSGRTRGNDAEAGAEAPREPVDAAGGLDV